MTDIVERLRYKYADLLHLEAADEIEHLNRQTYRLANKIVERDKEIERLRAALKDAERIIREALQENDSE